MKPEKTIGFHRVFGALNVAVPFALLANTFNFPGILRPGGTIVLTINKNDCYARQQKKNPATGFRQGQCK